MKQVATAGAAFPTGALAGSAAVIDLIAMEGSDSDVEAASVEGVRSESPPPGPDEQRGGYGWYGAELRA
eukprot:2756380-Alexandrium_andersonii.AAC.1